MSVNVTLLADSVEVTAHSRSQVQADLVDVNVGDMLSHISINEVLEYYGQSDILDAIGKSEAIEHFGIEGAE
ncbi:MAG: hypothetical protein ACRCXB_14005 [Aeromonadaceae bacterium]